MEEGREDLSELQDSDEERILIEEEEYYEDEEEATDSEEDDESIHDMVARLSKEIEAENEEESSEEPDQQYAEQEPVEIADPYESPAALSARSKEALARLPKYIREEIAALEKSRERTFHSAIQRARSEERESRSVREAIRPYYVSHPELAESGITESQFVTRLVAAHQKLTNPKTALQTWMGIGSQIGIDERHLADIAENYGGDKPAQVDIKAHPEFQALQQTVGQLQSQITAAQNAPVIAKVNEELNSVFLERDAQGNYVYPLMTRPGFYEQRVKPLALNLARIDPSLTATEAIKRAYAAVTGQGYSSQPNGAGLPARNIQNSKPSAISVRGRTSIPTRSNDGDFAPPEVLNGTMHDLVEWAAKRG